MVSQNLQKVKVDRKRRTKNQEQVIAAVGQNLLNMVLWQIINEHAPEEKAGGVLTVPDEDLKLVPATFALTVEPDPENGVVRIHAVVQEEKKNIILPDGSHLQGRTDNV